MIKFSLNIEERKFTIVLKNKKTGKPLIRKAIGKTRMVALANLLEKFKRPENYEVDYMTSAV